MCEGHHHEEGCCSEQYQERYEGTCGCGGAGHHRGHGVERGWGGHHGRYHHGPASHGYYPVGCCCHPSGEQGPGFHRRFRSRDERAADLEAYLKELGAEAEGVREALGRLGAGQ